MDARDAWGCSRLDALIAFRASLVGRSRYILFNGGYFSTTFMTSKADVTYAYLEECQNHNVVLVNETRPISAAFM